MFYRENGEGRAGNKKNRGKDKKILKAKGETNENMENRSTKKVDGLTLGGGG
jgi:hypothetical protein